MIWIKKISHSDRLSRPSGSVVQISTDYIQHNIPLVCQQDSLENYIIINDSKKRWLCKNMQGIFVAREWERERETMQKREVTIKEK